MAAGCDSGGGDAPGTDAAAEVAAEVAAGDDADALPPPVTAAEVLTPGPWAAGELLLEFEDTTRSTPANGDHPSTPTRVLDTLIWYPAAPGEGDPLEPVREAPPSVDGGPWPVIVYCHGFSSRKDENQAVAALLASRGFVVVAMDFPLTNIFAPGQPTVLDVVNQPGDVQFVLDSVLALGHEVSHPLHGRLDEDRIALAGVSLGAMTSLAVAFHPDMRDPRIKAVAAGAPPGCFLAPEIYQEAAIPILVVHGTADEILDYASNGPPAYQRAQPPKYFLTLDGGTHTAMAWLAKPLLDVLGNTDDVGCDTVGDNPTLDPATLAQLSADLGGVDYETALTECPAPCTTSPASAGTMDADRQLELIALSFTAFFEARIHGDLRYEAFLRHELTRDATDANLQFQP